MFRCSRIAMTAAVALSLASQVAAQGRSFEPPPSRSASGVLSLPSTASPRAVLVQYLRAQGRDEATVASIVQAGSRAGRNGLRHAEFEQRANGMPVYGTYARAAVSQAGVLVNVVENVVRVPAQVARARVNAQQAVAAAVAHLYPQQATGAGFFRQPPTATRVAIPHEDGTMSAGYLVETWTDRRNQLHETLVDGDGTVLFVESRTNDSTDQYNVFLINPDITPQAVVSGPGATTESPAGWLSGAQLDTQVTGNNVRAYLDTDADNTADAGGTAVSDGHFLSSLVDTVSPSTANNKRVAVQNLFYLNNRIHDELYRHGFTESAANFQLDNFGRGGRGRDPVLAEAQDGASTDNANFATPREGFAPRMQMFLWTGDGPTAVVTAGGIDFEGHGADFGPALTTTPVNGVIRLANDGVGTATDACEALAAGSMGGAIALVDRGTCDFDVKVKNAQNAGAVAVIVANNQGGDAYFVMGGDDATVTIPAVMVSQNAGATIRAMGVVAGSVRRVDVLPLQRDGDLDGDIVSHEYCHGLTWRMIGRMSGPVAGAIGEGMSDLCSLLLNGHDDAGNELPGADVVGEYSFSNAAGIRRHPYKGYPNTYGDITGASVHDDGEPYAAIGWRLIELFGTTKERRDVLFGHLVDGMNFTPSNPKYEEMRDGILAAIGVPPAPGNDACLVWQAFGQFGVGVGAKATVRRTTVTVTESFAVPAACQ